MSVNNDNFLLEPEDMEFAQKVCANVTESKRGRAVANVIASIIAGKNLEDYDPDIDSGIHNVAQVLNNIDISDFYIKGNYIDARIYFNDNELCIPKSHFELDILPIAYMFIKPDEDLTSGVITGFVFPDDIDISKENGEYYFIDEDALKSIYDLEGRISAVEDADFDIDFEKQVYAYLDGTLDNLTDFYQTLLKSQSAREYLLDAAKAYSVYSSLDADTSREQESGQMDEADNLPEESGDIDILEESAAEGLIEQTDLDEVIEPLDAGETESLDFAINAEIEELTSPEEIENITEEFLPAEDDFTLSEDVDIDIVSPEDNEILLPEEEIEEELPPSEEIPEEIEAKEEFENTFGEAFDNEEAVDEEVEAEEEIENTFEEALDDEEVVDEEAADEEVETADSEYDDLSKFDYSTEIIPSIKDIEAEDTEEAVEEDRVQDTEEEVTAEESENKQEEIEDLFDGENPEMPNETPKKKSGILPLLGVLVVMGALGYYGYTKYMSGAGSLSKAPEPPITNVGKTVKQDNIAEQQNTAMPNETIDKLQPAAPVTNEAVSVEIPEIEQNLSASIEVSNLSVNWEVPISYANNATAKRYFVKIGKVLQLNLKTEFLLLSTPPISNKITVELEYSKDNHKFSAGKIIQSSGVKNIDELVQATLKKVLSMNMNVNMSVFDNLQGNPVLVIKL